MTRRALFIASAKTGPELKAGQDDCLKFHGVMTNPQHGGVDPDLSDPVLFDCPSDSDFLLKINEFIKKSDAADQRVVYFTGHGVVSRGEYCLIFDGSHKLPFVAITSLLAGKGPGKTLFILDTCHSGAADLGRIKNDAELPMDPAGSCVFASSRDIEVSREDDALGSLFTHYLCDCIASGNGGQPTTEGLISVSDASTYVSTKLHEHSERPQNPRYSIKSAEGNVWIAKNKSGSMVVERNSGDSDSVVDNHRRICSGATFEDLDAGLVEQYANEYLGTTTSNFRELIAKLDLSFAPNGVQPNEAAILCFGVRPERFFPNARSTFSVGDLTSSQFENRAIEGPLVRQLDELLHLTLGQLSRKSTFGNTGRRSDQFEIPRDVIREVISNALAHRNFEANGQVRIHITDEAVEISNPGSFPKDHPWRELLEAPGPSLAPNRRVANHLQRLGAYEGIGRGFSILKRFCEEFGEGSIEFQQNGTFVTCRLKRRYNQTPEVNTFNRAELDDRLTKYLKERSNSLAKTNNLLGQQLGDFFVEPNLIDEKSSEHVPFDDFIARIIARGNTAFVSGSVGSGKSYLLAHSANFLATAYNSLPDSNDSENGSTKPKRQRVFPILVSLREIRLDLPILAALSLAVGIEHDLIEYAFQNYQPVLFGDGLDEVAPGNRERIVEVFENLKAEHPHSSLVVSSRPVSADLASQNADNVFTLGDLSERSMKEILARTFGSESQRVSHYLINTNTQFLRNPLLLSLAAKILDQFGHIPNEESALFDLAIDALTQDHDASKGIFNRQRKSRLGARELQQLLKALALIMVVKNIANVEDAAFQELVGEALEVSNFGSTDRRSVAQSDLVSDLVESGLVVRVGSGLEFLHRSLMEHLAIDGASLFIADAEDLVRTLSQMLRQNSDRDLIAQMISGWIKDKKQANQLLLVVESTLADRDGAELSDMKSVKNIIESRMEELRSNKHGLSSILVDRY